MCAKGLSEKNLAYLVAGSCPPPKQFCSVKSLLHHPLQGPPLHGQMMEALLLLHAERDSPRMHQFCTASATLLEQQTAYTAGLVSVITVDSWDYAEAPVF